MKCKKPLIRVTSYSPLCSTAKAATSHNQHQSAFIFRNCNETRASNAPAQLSRILILTIVGREQRLGCVEFHLAEAD